ncbi:hypothetical protein [Pseudomonas sp. McL0111]|uniref:hypothetical protein n=1 Tax=Pseudomonas sp. McL0111 TaxID=3457357 RepID=UPI00403E5020
MMAPERYPLFITGSNQLEAVVQNELKEVLQIMSLSSIAVLYRWKLHAGKEEAFKEAWTSVSEQLIQRGSLGSRLHRAADGLWYSYAAWPSIAHRDEAFNREPLDARALKVMSESIAQSYPEVVMEPVADLLL